MDKKTIICTKVEYTDYRNVDSIQNNEVVFNDDNLVFSALNTESATLTQTSNNSDAGVYITQELSILAEMNIDAAKVFERVPMIYRLTTDKNDSFIWGTVLNPTRPKSLERNFNETKMVYQRKATSFEF